MASVEGVTAFASSKLHPADERGKQKLNVYLGFTFTLHRIAYVSILIYGILLYFNSTTVMSCSAVGGFTDSHATDICKARKKFLRFGPTKKQMDSGHGRKVNNYKNFDEFFAGYSDEDVVEYWGLFPQLVLVVLSGMVYLGRFPWDHGLACRIRIVMSEVVDVNLPPAEKQANLAKEIKGLANTVPFFAWDCLTQFTALASFLIPATIMRYFFKLDVLTLAFLDDMRKDTLAANDAINRAFPSFVGCIIPSYGASGSLQMQSSLCTFNNNSMFLDTLMHLTLFFGLLFILAVVDTMYLVCSLIIKRGIYFKNVPLNEAFLLMLMRQNLSNNDFNDLYKRIVNNANNTHHIE